MKSKSITDLSDEDLLKSIESPDLNQPAYSWHTDVMQFISVYNLKQGQEVIFAHLLYKLYRHWSKDPVKQVIFSHTLADIFPTIKSNRSIGIMLNRNVLDVSNELYKFLQEDNPTKYKGHSDHFKKYLSHYSINKGGIFIANSVLYNLYDKWCYKNKRRRQLGPNQFDKFCKIFFEQKMIRGCKWSAIDNSIEQHLTEDLINLMYKKKATRNGKKENKKKRS